MDEEPKALWAVYTTDDLNEGRSGNYVKHICRNEATAIRLGRKGYVQGSDCPIKQIQTTVVDGKHYLDIGHVRVIAPTPDDVRLQVSIDARRAASERAKQLGLTDEEIALLRA